MNRRRFLISTVGASTVVVGRPWLASPGAATDDELAYANFGASAELLVHDFYSRALAAKVVSDKARVALRHGRAASALHAKTLADLLVGAGDVPPLQEDFVFDWPARTFETGRSTMKTGIGVLRPLLGAYQSATASVSEPSYRVLYASLAASVGQQLGTLTAIGGPIGAESFPVALDLEAASAALDRYLG